MDKEHIPALIALNKLFLYSTKPGNRIYEYLKNSGRNPEEFFSHPEEAFRATNLEMPAEMNISPALLEEACKENEALTAQGIQFAGPDDFPRRYRQVPDSSLLLYMKTQSEPWMVLNQKMVAFAGTRDCSVHARHTVRHAIQKIAESDKKTCVIAGLSFGIETEAHQAALDCGLTTVAVLPNGIDSVYPLSNRGLAEEIASTPGCALITPFPPGKKPDAFNMLKRLTVIASLSNKIILVESKTKGSVIVTARLAYDYGDRKIFAFPGNLDDEKAKGCNRLIREGIAEIVTDYSDILL